MSLVGQPRPSRRRILVRDPLRLHANDVEGRSGFALSAAQQGIWFDQQIRPASIDYNSAEYVDIDGPVDCKLFEAAITQVISEADALRVRIVYSAEAPIQIIGAPARFSLPIIDVSAEPNALEAAQAWMNAERKKTIDLIRGPVFSFALLKLASDKFYWFTCYHHIVIDGYGRSLIVKRVASIYTSLASELDVGDRAFGPLNQVLAEDAAYRKSKDYEEDRQFWIEKLVGCPEPTNVNGRPFASPDQFVQHGVALGAETKNALQAVAHKVSFPRIITAATAIFHHLMTGVEDLALGFQVAARTSDNSQRTPAMLTNVVPVRLTICSDMTVSEVITQTNEKTREALRHQRYPISQIRGLLGRTTNDRPILDPLVNFIQFDDDIFFAGYRSSTHILAPGPIENLSIRICHCPRLAKTSIAFYANPATYSATALDHYQQQYMRLLGSLVNPNERIGKLDILAPPELRQLTVEWNETQVEFPRDKCVHELIEEQVRRTPDSIAVDFAKQKLTYRELNRRADQLSGRLRSLDVGPGVLVALCVERSLDMLIGVLGILKSGAAYLSLDPAYPRERLAFMLSEVGPRVLLTQQRSRVRLPPHSAHEIILDIEPPSPLHCGAGPKVDNEPTADDLAYLIYTSGSTGTPKGVQIEHRGLVNLLTAMARSPGFEAHDTLLAVTSLSFDIAALELLLPLTRGGRLVIAGSDVVGDGVKLSSLIDECKATVMQATPATWRLLLQSGWKGRNALKILCGGEAWTTALAGELLPRCNSLWNMYGPTETTIWSSAGKVEFDRPILIGPPIANTTFYVLNGCCQPVPIGVPGELFIGGEGVARGYLNRPELMGQKFIADPFSRGLKARLYKTGDRVRHLPDGNLEFLGRIDNQVKLRGYRIELNEIEAALNLHPNVEASVVALREYEQGENDLVAYFTSSGPSRNLVNELRELVRRRLPAYMLPSEFVVLESFPLTTNGKIDRKKLPRLERLESHRPYVPPRTKIEIALANICNDILKLKQTSIHDNFFDLGGHSLLMLRFIAQIEKDLRVRLPLTAIFRAPSIAQLADQIRNSKKADEDERRALFCFGYGVSIAQHLTRCLSVYELDLHSEAIAATPHIKTLAASYVREIRSIQPMGPYFLSGYSAAGIVAYETAQQLLAQGEDVAMLAMLESQPYRARFNWPKSLWPRLVKHLRQFPWRWPSQWANYAHARARTISQEAMPPHVPHDPAWLQLMQLQRFYRMRPYSHPIVIFLSAEGLSKTESLRKGWAKKAAAEFKFIVTPGDHHTMIMEPHVRVLAAQLKACLDEAVRSRTHCGHHGRAEFGSHH